MKRIDDLKKQMLDYQYAMDRQLNLKTARQNSTEGIDYTNRKEFISNTHENKKILKKDFLL